MPPLAFSDAVPTVTGTGDGAVVSAIGYRPEVLAAGAGNETLIAAAGNDTLAAGNGATEMIGGTGDAIFLFVNGASGGTVTIENFVPGQDFVALRGYGSAAGVNAIASEVVGGGSSTVTLPDKSRITFANVANLTANDFR
jgi:Ca2+-binding RTX toxin-like protein